MVVSCFVRTDQARGGRQPGNDRELIQRELLGASIMTRYNNKCYRIDDIDFDATPRSTFEHFGQQTSYADYYK